ncbi:MAG TPA: G5 domain-containing protein [Anaerolineales bacterium]|nr:G5 domain-containing protein [Anaerolineales bacterium]
MRLYHRPITLIWAGLIVLAGCTPPAVTADLITVRITADGSTGEISIPAGSTVQDVLAAAGLEAVSPDRTEPPLYTILAAGSEILVIRVTEEFSVDEIVIPFDKQVVRNEALPEGETRLIQPGVNGVHEITVRRLYEDGVEVSSGTVSTVVIQEAVPEIIMVGSQTPFTQVEIAGRLAYLSAGIAWVMEGSTGSRRPVVTTGDLDGQVFRLSPNGEWLLFTRRSEAENEINSLWVARVAGGEEQLIDLGARNIIHFADWVPTSVLRVAYSTVEPRETAPGWQANNDLQLLSFSTSGWVARPTVALDTNAGGIYGWWGTNFALAPDGVRLAYARPDGVGVLDLREGVETFLRPVLEMPPLNTGGDWAWVPGLAWAPTGNILFTVRHAAPADETSQFDLTALPLEAGGPVPLATSSGMFAYPATSPILVSETGELAYQVAYLQAVFPDQSETSGYRLVVMDRDGSNRSVLFPAEGEPGLLPQQVLWSSELRPGSSGFWIAFLYNGNLFLVDTVSGDSFQLTGDGLINRLDWR